jgi:hypothetical protein
MKMDIYEAKYNVLNRFNRIITPQLLSAIETLEIYLTLQCYEQQKVFIVNGRWFQFIMHMGRHGFAQRRFKFRRGRKQSFYYVFWALSINDLGRPLRNGDQIFANHFYADEQQYLWLANHWAMINKAIRKEE